jgi:ribosome biogenesis protein ENP2
LDSITEELEEDTQPVVFDDYKFVTREDLEALSLSHLIGTGVLKASMHGFYIDNRLYNKAKQVSNPFAYEEYR